MKDKIATLLTEFRQEGFACDVEAVQAEYEKKQTQATPLSIQILSILGGISGTAFLLGFLVLIGILDSDATMGVLGVGFLIGAIILNSAHDKPLLDTTSVAFYIIGYLLLAVAIGSVAPACIIFIAISLMTLIVVQNFMLSFLATLAITGSIAFLIVDSGNSALMYTYITFLILLVNYLFFEEAKLLSYSPKICRLYRPVRVATLFSLMLLLIVIAVPHHWMALEPSNWVLLPSAIGISAILYLVSHIIVLLKVEATIYKLTMYASVLLLLLPTVMFPPLVVSLMIILLSFRFNYKTGFVIGILFFVYFVGQYYYDLNLTLLTKSILMFFSGVLFLLFFLFTRHKLASK